jgi:hypothetical protein
MALGSKSEPGAFVPIGAGYYLPYTGGIITGNLDVTGYVACHGFLNTDGWTQSRASAPGSNSYFVLLDSAGTLQGYMGWEPSSDDLIFVNDPSGAILRLKANGVSEFNSSVTCGGPLTANGGLGIPASAWSTIYNSYGWVGQANGGSFMLQGPGSGNSAFMTFHCPGEFAGNFGLHGGRMQIGGWSWGAGNMYQVWTAQDFANPACDYRIKDAVAPLDSTWDHVKALKPIRYRQREFALPHTEKYSIIEADDRERWGFIAHELQETLGDTAAHCPKDDPDRLQAPNLMMLVAALTKTVQELQARVEELEAR